MAAPVNKNILLAVPPPFPDRIPRVKLTPEEKWRIERDAFAACFEYVEMNRPEDQYNLAMMYYQGDGTKRDYANAFEGITRRRNKVTLWPSMF